MIEDLTLYPPNYRRFRQTSRIRSMMQTHRLHPSMIIYPLFVKEELQREVETVLTNVSYHTFESICFQIDKALEKGIFQFLLFTFPKEKKETDFTYDFTVNFIYNIKKRYKDNIVLMVDICLCPYTISGQCGFIKYDNNENWIIENESSVKELTKMAINMASANVDVIAPSDVFDDRIKSIRIALDKNQYSNKLIMSYSTKMSSAFYGPFRCVLQSSPKTGDRKTYQMDFANVDDAIRSSLRDIEQGADIIMVKPAALNLDIIHRLSIHPQSQYVPLAAYQVGGEIESYRLLEKNNMGVFKDLYAESLIGIIRSGAKLVITYGALEIDFENFT